MKIQYTPNQERLRRELRKYFSDLVPPQVERDLAACGRVGPLPREIWKRVCDDGWAGIGWPEEYGGQGRSAMEQFIFYDEATRAGVPVPMLGLNTVGPTIMEHGTPEQKSGYLPRILSGEIHFSVAYTEPHAGTDLAALNTRAVRDGNEYVINGRKVFTSLANDADFIWLAARTGGPRHKGISIFIVPTDSPGLEIVPGRMLSDHDIASTFYDDVRVPATCLVGVENDGWKLITSQLNHERLTICPPGWVDRVLDEVVAWARRTLLPDGRRVIDEAWVQLSLARVRARLEFLRVLNWKVAWSISHGELAVTDASSVKVYGSEFQLEAFRSLQEIVGQRGYLTRDSLDEILQARLEGLYRDLLIQTFGGGTNEIQRDLIAHVGLGLPRPTR